LPALYVWLLRGWWGSPGSGGLKMAAEVEKARGLKKWLAARRPQRGMEKLVKALDLMAEAASAGS